MKRISLLLATIIFLLVLPSRAFAHLPGQPPFFKINDRYSNLYPVPSTSLTDFTLPQDLGPSTYQVGQPINFELATDLLPVPKEIVQRSEFFWDMGDLSKATGLKNSHTYSKPGYYFLTVNVQAPGDSQSQLLESVLFNVLPDKNYQLPQAQITVNGQQNSGSVVAPINALFSKPVMFDGGKSQGGSGKIISFFWDFGDGKSGSGAKTSHQYANDLTQAFVVLRVKNSDGFIADSFIEVDNKNGPAVIVNNQKKAAPEKKSSDNLNLAIGGIIILALFIGGFILGKQIKKHR